MTLKIVKRSAFLFFVSHVVFFVSPNSAIADYGDWGLLNFGPSASAETIDAFADPDSDGMVNLLEYAYGRNPLVSDFTEPTPTLSAGRLTLTLLRPKDRFDLLYYFQFADSVSGPWL